MSKVEPVVLPNREMCADKTGVVREIVVAPDGDVESTNGCFVVDEESGRLAREAFEAHGTDLPIDLEHQTLGGEYASPDGSAPAVGWITDLRYERGRGIVATVEWTVKGRELLQTKAYRYLSPVVIVRKSDRKLVGLHSAALTNKPAIIHMEALAAKQRSQETPMTVTEKQAHQEEATGGGDIGILIGEIIANLGIEAGEDLLSTLRNIKDATKKKGGEPEEGGEEEVAASVRVATRVCKELGLPPDADGETVVNKIREKDGHVGYVKASEHQKALARLQTLEQTNRAREADELVNTCVSAGKLNPNDRDRMDWAREQARTNTESFKSLMDGAPAIGPPQGQTTPPKDGAGGASNEETLINKALEEHKGNHKEALVALQSRLMVEHTSAGLTKQAARQRCERLYPTIFG